MHMNQEIKFRVWDAHLDRMLYLENDCMWDTNWLNTSFAMQFIGLVDKTGTEIYKEDFVSGSYMKPYGRYGQQKAIKFAGVVKYKFGQFYIKIGETKDGIDRCLYFSQLWPLSPNSVEIEVNGNIYQKLISAQ